MKNKFDLQFVLRDCGGDISKAQKRIESFAREIRNEALEEAAKWIFVNGCCSPENCGCNAKAYEFREALALAAKESEK